MAEELGTSPAWSFRSGSRPGAPWPDPSSPLPRLYADGVRWRLSLAAAAAARLLLVCFVAHTGSSPSTHRWRRPRRRISLAATATCGTEVEEEGGSSSHKGAGRNGEVSMVASDAPMNPEFKQVDAAFFAGHTPGQGAADPLHIYRCTLEEASH